MILRTGAPTALPREYAYRAVVLLDPGVSTDHSVFLDAYRKLIRDSIASRCDMDVSKVRPRCYILYAEESHACRYGLGNEIQSVVPDHWNKWEVRPRKWNPKTIHHKTRKWGLAATFCRMEINSHKGGMMAPWRFTPYGDQQPRHDRRPVGVLLEPTKLDLKFFHEKEHLWHNFQVMPRLYLGAHTIGRLPPTFMRWLYGLLALTPAGLAAAEQALQPFDDIRAYPVTHSHFLTKGSPKYAFGAAHNFDSGGKRLRSHSTLHAILDWAGFPAASRFIPEHGTDWWEVAEATNCAVYAVLSQDESLIPYDGLLALAGGALVFAPDLPVWRSVKTLAPSRVALYPVRSQGHNRCVWAAQDVAAQLKAALRHRKLPWRP